MRAYTRDGALCEEPDCGLTPEELRELSDHEHKLAIGDDADSWWPPELMDDPDAWGDQ